MTRLLPALTLLAAATAAYADNERYACAYALDDGHLLYTEVHDRTIENGRFLADRVRYVLPDGSELGHKVIDFSADPFLPAYRLELTREGYAEGLSPGAGGIALMRQPPHGAAETATMEKSGVLVADAGMLRLLQARFDALSRGETVSFRVVAPSRLSSYRFRARKADDSALHGAPVMRVQVEMDSMLKLFAGPLLFTFTPEGKLIEFRGPTNVRNPATGKEYAVRLAFYATPPPEAGPVH